LDKALKQLVKEQAELIEANKKRVKLLEDQLDVINSVIRHSKSALAFHPAREKGE